MTHYDIAVQRWPLPWSTRFQVVEHFWSDDESRLTLVFPSGDSLQFPRMDRRRVKIFANYKDFKLYQAAQSKAAYEAQLGAMGDASAQLHVEWKEPQKPSEEPHPVTEQLPEPQPSEAT